jgi:thioredoxin 1
MRRHPLSGTLFGALFGALVVLALGRSAPAVEERLKDVPVVRTQAQFEQSVVQAPGPVMVDFYATWCGPCRVLAPTIAGLERDYRGRVAFVRVDGDQSRDLVQAYHVAGYPTVILFNKGKPVGRWPGVGRAKDYRAAMDSVLTK